MVKTYNSFVEKTFGGSCYYNATALTPLIYQVIACVSNTGSPITHGAKITIFFKSNLVELYSICFALASTGLVVVGFFILLLKLLISVFQKDSNLALTSLTLLLCQGVLCNLAFSLYYSQGVLRVLSSDTMTKNEKEHGAEIVLLNIWSS